MSLRNSFLKLGKNGNLIDKSNEKCHQYIQVASCEIGLLFCIFSLIMINDPVVHDFCC